MKLNLRVAWLVPAVVVLLAFGVNTAFADEVMESIQEAIEYYKEGDYAEAKSSLDYASQVIGQLRSESMQKFLPEPLAGWTAEEGSSSSAGAAMFGGMTGAAKTYRKDGGSRVKIEIMGDSPMLQGMLGMFSNPAYATADGGKLKKIKRQKAIIKYRAAQQRGEINIVIAKRYLVKIDGRQVAEQDLIDYASAIDFTGLKKF